MQSQYPDVTVMETLAAKMELPVEKICVRREHYTCHARVVTTASYVGNACCKSFYTQTHAHTHTPHTHTHTHTHTPTHPHTHTPTHPHTHTPTHPHTHTPTHPHTHTPTHPHTHTPTHPHTQVTGALQVKYFSEHAFLT